MSPVGKSRSGSAAHLVVEFDDPFNRQDVPGMMSLMSVDCVFENTGPAPDGTV